MIRLEDVSVTYAGRSEPALRNVTAQVDEGELCLVIGPTGAGKSTLLRAACGRTPHFTGGLLTGRVLIDGRDTRHHRPRELVADRDVGEQVLERLVRADRLAELLALRAVVDRDVEHALRETEQLRGFLTHTWRKNAPRAWLKAYDAGSGR